MINFEAELLEFYSEWLAWATRNACNNQPFSRSLGLCANLHLFSVKRNHRQAEMIELQELIRKQFIDAGLSEEYPFGFNTYSLESQISIAHLNPARRAWVRDRLAGIPIKPSEES